MKKMGMKLTATGLVSILLLGLAACGTPEKPVEQPKTTAAAAPQTEWEMELEKVYEAAKQEGELIVIGQPGTNREELMKDFEAAYPGIAVKYTGMRNNEIAAKVQAEQAQGKYLTDVAIEGVAQETVDLRALVIRPDIKDDKNWYGGFEDGWSLLEDSIYHGRYVYGLLAGPTIHVNNDVIPEGEIKTIEDLLDPKWKGKILVRDFTKPGQATVALTGIAHQEGKEFVEKLIFTQQPVMNDDDRQNAEWFSMGKYPIAIGLDTTTLDKFTGNQIVQKVQRLRQEKATIYTPFSLAVLKDSPHPNASKLFVNWYLSKEGQEKFVDKLKNYLSRRTDVAEPPSPEVIPWAEIDQQKAVPYYSKEGSEISDWVLELGKKYKASL